MSEDVVSGYLSLQKDTFEDHPKGSTSRRSYLFMKYQKDGRQRKNIVAGGEIVSNTTDCGSQEDTTGGIT